MNYQGEPHVISGVLKWGRGRQKRGVSRATMMENEWEKLYVAAFEDGGRGHKQRNVSSL